MESPVPILTPAGREEVFAHLQKSLDAAFGHLVEAVILKGSLYKGDFIPYFSDCDIHVFVRPQAMQGPRAPRLSYCLKFQKAFGTLDPEYYGVSQFQVYFVDVNHWPGDWTPPLPDTYELVYGTLPSGLPVPREDELRRRAGSFLNGIPGQIWDFIQRFVDKPDDKLDGVVRLLGTLLKPAAYQTAIVLGEDPISIWTRPRQDVVSMVEAVVGCSGWTRFYDGVQPWPEVRCDPDQLRELFAEGTSTLGILSDWWQQSSMA